MQIDYGSSSLSQWAAAEWLSSGLYTQHLETVRVNLTIRLRTMLEALEKYLWGIATWNIPKGGFFIWIKILPSISMQKLFEAALAEGVLFYPTVAFFLANIFRKSVLPLVITLFFFFLEGMLKILLFQFAKGIAKYIVMFHLNLNMYDSNELISQGAKPMF